MSKQDLPGRPAALVTEVSRMFLGIVGKIEQMYDPWDIASDERFTD